MSLPNPGESPRTEINRLKQRSVSDRDAMYEIWTPLFCATSDTWKVDNPMFCPTHSCAKGTESSSMVHLELGSCEN